MKRTTIVVLTILSLFSLAFFASVYSGDKKSDSKTPWIGVYVQHLDEDLAEAFELTADNGFVIIEVAPDSPADKAGLREKDIIICFDDKVVSDDETLADLVEEHEVGDQVSVVYLRRGKENTKIIEIGERPETEDRQVWVEKTGPVTRTMRLEAFGSTYIGVSVIRLTDQLGEYFGVSEGAGLLITEVFRDSPAEKAGLKAGDVITDAGGEKVAEPSELQDIILEKEEGETVDITFVRDRKAQTLSVEVAEDKAGLNAFYSPLGFPLPEPDVLKYRFFGNDGKSVDLFESRDDEMAKLRKELGELRKELESLKEKIKP